MDSDDPADATSSGDHESSADSDSSPGRRLGKLGWTALSIAVTTVVGIVAAWGVNTFLANINAVHVETFNDLDAIDSRHKLGGGEYLFPGPIQDMGPPPSDADTCYDRYRWAHSKGGLDVGSTVSRVSITAKQGHSVQVVGVEKIPVGERKTPAIGSMVTCGGKGGLPIRHIALERV